MQHTATDEYGYAQVWLDGSGPFPGTLTRERVYEQVQTAGQMVKPDPAWSHTDPAGHYHAYTRLDEPLVDDSLPTLRRDVRHVPCDGVHFGLYAPEVPCDGTSEVHWMCQGCGAEVEPGVIPDGSSPSLLTEDSWEVRVDAVTGTPASLTLSFMPGLQRMVSVRAVVGPADGEQVRPLLTLFGFLAVADAETTFADGEGRTRLSLTGALHHQPVVLPGGVTARR